MKASAQVTSKGQITIPQEVRTQLGLKQGDKVGFEIIDGVATMKPLPKEEDPFAEFEGAFPAFDSKEEVNAWIAELRDND